MSGFAFETDPTGKLVVKVEHDPEKVAAFKARSAEQVRRIKHKSSYWREREAVSRQEEEPAASSRVAPTAKSRKELPRKIAAAPVNFGALQKALLGFKRIISDRFATLEQRVAELEQRNRALASSREPQS
jgi:hypothetical protein